MSTLNKPGIDFSDTNEFVDFISAKKKGELIVGYFDFEGYDGMALSIMIIFDTRTSQFDLDLQWISLGLDLFGDTLQESYVYRFPSIIKLLEYLASKYLLSVSDIPLSYSFDNKKFPNPITHTNRKSDFKASWKNFQTDFKKGVFLDTTQELIYDSLEHKS
ncbi:MAG: hypothetical protein JJ971_14685 [Balneolaceae bacterium]|nr:hypothetical protein [Balneolaceae bacterium]MBO6547644.1 hypothetical protein [Balneolaceae bacterium]MBO6648155.1 hypothetical protein [Balneolaceae bacterium]